MRPRTIAGTQLDAADALRVTKTKTKTNLDPDRTAAVDCAAAPAEGSQIG